MGESILIDPRWGAVCWSLSTVLWIYRDKPYWIAFSAFWAGVSIYRLLALRADTGKK